MSALLVATLTSGAVFLASVSLLRRPGPMPPPRALRLPVGARARRRDQKARA